MAVSSFTAMGSCSYRAFMCHTSPEFSNKFFEGGKNDEWWQSEGWISHKFMEKYFSLDRFKLVRVGKSFSGDCCASSIYNRTCVEFEVYEI